jgi:hypothetical protein
MNTCASILLSLCAVALAAPLHAQSASPAQLKGSFLVVEQGFAAGAPLASLALLQFDGAGVVSGVQVRQGPGLLAQEQVSGYYAVWPAGDGAIALNTYVADETGGAPLLLANYKFLRAGATGGSAIRSDNGVVSIAHIHPAAAATSLTGEFSFVDLGESPSGQGRAEIGQFRFNADGTLAGRMLVKQSTLGEIVEVNGAYVRESSGLWTLKLYVPGATDEDGATTVETVTYTAAATAQNELLTIRQGNQLLGVGALALTR